MDETKDSIVCEEVSAEDQIYMDKVEPIFPRAKCTYATIRHARALMIEMRTKNGFSDFDRNLKVVKKYMKLNKLHEKKLIYDDLLAVYEPSS